MASNAQPWFVAVVVAGLQRLIALGLPGTPPSETMKLTGQAWVDALWNTNLAWDQQRDANRITAGFLDLTRFVTRWPVPAQLRDAMPSRTQQLKLDTPSPTPEQRAQSQDVIGEALRQSAKKHADPLRWARRILEREAAGEHMPMIATQFAREALTEQARTDDV